MSNLPCINPNCAGHVKNVSSITGCSAHNWHAVTSCVDYRTLSPTDGVVVDAPYGIAKDISLCAGCRDGNECCAECPNYKEVK